MINSVRALVTLAYLENVAIGQRRMLADGGHTATQRLCFERAIGLR